MKIITDCDGVLLDWLFAFDVWMIERGHSLKPGTSSYFEQSQRYGLKDDVAKRCIKEFNEGPSVGYLPAYKDSVEYVTKLAQEGFRFEVISSLHIDKYAQKLRVKNLKHLFGEVFDHIDCGLNFETSKKEALEARYKDTGYIWIEDSIDHALAGEAIGLEAYIMDHSYNKNYKGNRLKNWSNLYNILT